MFRLWLHEWLCYNDMGSVTNHLTINGQLRGLISKSYLWFTIQIPITVTTLLYSLKTFKRELLKQKLKTIIVGYDWLLLPATCAGGDHIRLISITGELAMSITRRENLIAYHNKVMVISFHSAMWYVQWLSAYAVIWNTASTHDKLLITRITDITTPI